MDYAKQYQEYLVRVNAALETACDTYLPEGSRRLRVQPATACWAAESASVPCWRWPSAIC